MPGATLHTNRQPSFNKIRWGEHRREGGAWGGETSWWCGGRDISIRGTTKSMATLSQIIKQDRYPVWLADALILSAVAYSDNPRQELETLNTTFGLPETAIYEFLEEDKLRKEGFEIGRKQVLLVVKSLAKDHMIIACRGTTGFIDALTDLNIMQRSLSLGAGAAHVGFLDRAERIPLKYLRRQLIQGNKIVLTGHSLGRAVASLLTLRLLESSPKFCHEQVQCYSFGCPLFADSKLAKHINSRYRRHFVHIVSKSDIVPMLMPFAHFLYTLWAGLEVGPLEDVFNITRLALLVWQVLPRIRKQRLGIATVATQAVSWVPGLIRGFVHRLLALALSYHSGSGYSFAGQMVLLDADRSFDEDIDDSSDVDKHLAFQFTQVVSMDSINEHSLLSYIENVFSVKTKEEESDSEPEVHRTTVSVSLADGRDRKSKLSNNRIRLTEFEPETSHSTENPAGNILNKRKNSKSFRSKVACLIFAKRMQESAPIPIRQKPKERKMACNSNEKPGQIGQICLQVEHTFRDIFHLLCSYAISQILCIAIANERTLWDVACIAISPVQGKMFALNLNHTSRCLVRTFQLFLSCHCSEDVRLKINYVRQNGRLLKCKTVKYFYAVRRFPLK